MQNYQVTSEYVYSIL